MERGKKKKKKKEPNIRLYEKVRKTKRAVYGADPKRTLHKGQVGEEPAKKTCRGSREICETRVKQVVTQGKAT